MSREDLLDAIFWLENKDVAEPASLGTWNIEYEIEGRFPGGIAAFVAENERMRKDAPHGV